MLGEFQTLVRPGAPIPPFISVLTGITDAMVATAPSIEVVLPQFLDFTGDAVLVAHNAPFDVGFLKAAAVQCERAWPTLAVLDTARLARRVLTRDEVRDCKLSTLARHFRATTTPNHRALADARATVDVLHGLIERVGTEGVQSFEELVTYSSRVSTAQRRKRHLAEGLPHVPGRLRLPGRRRADRSTSASPSTCGPASAPTSPAARRAAGWARWSGSPSRSATSRAPPRSRPRSASCG